MTLQPPVLPLDFDNVLRFLIGTKDLATASENWKSDTFDNRWTAANNHAYHLKGYYPSPNSRPIREGIIPIKESTTMDLLRHLSSDIRDRYGIDCFQIAIDRSNHRAKLLFDFFNRDTGRNIFINASQHKMLSAMVVRQIGLPRIFVDPSHTGYLLRERYQTDPAVFKKLLTKLNRSRLGEDSSLLVSEVVEYVTQMCQNRVK